MNLGISNLEQLPYQTANAFEELIVQIQAWANGRASTIDPNQTTARPFDSSTLFDHVNNQFSTNAPWSLRWLNGPWLADPDGNSTHVAILRPPTWAGNQHDYAPTGIDTALGMELETDAARNLTGVKIAARSKRFLLIVNVGNYAITIKHNDPSSAAVNRFGLPAGADLVLGSAEMAWMFYSVGSEVWRLAGTSAPASAWGGGIVLPATNLTPVQLNIYPSQYRTLNSAPVSLIAAPGANTSMALVSWVLEQDLDASTGGSNYSASVAVSLRFSGVAQDLVTSIGVSNPPAPVRRYVRYAGAAATPNSMGNGVSVANTAIVVRSTADVTGGPPTDVNPALRVTAYYATFAALG